VSTTVSVVSPSGAKGADVELPDEIFSAKVNVPLMHQVVVAQEAAARQGTHATKTRGLVRGGGKKPYRQKGTGRARQGSVRAPQYAGGGTVHGPQPRSYVQRTPKKMKAAALRGALSDRASNGRVAVVSQFVDGEVPSTSGALDVLRTAIGLLAEKLRGNVLVVTQPDDELTWKSLRNVRGVRLLTVGQLNTYDVLVSEHVVFTQAALADFTGNDTAAPAKTEAAAPAKTEAAAPARKAAAPARKAAAPAKEAAEPAKDDADAPAKDDADAPATSEAAAPAKKAPARKTAKKEDDQ
jgi:large subunit ribosomal protein L4